jgi:hypothetical protein
MTNKDFEQMKTDIALIRQDIQYIKERVTKVEMAVYSVGGVIIMGVLGAIIKLVILP